MRNFLIIIGFLIVLTSCTVNKQLVTLNTNEEEAIVGGKLKVLYNGKDVTEESTILFNEIMTGKYNYRADSTGFIVTKLPIGESFMSRVSYLNFFTNLPKESTDFVLTTNDKVTYIGDLTVNWVGDGSKISGMFGLVGAVIDEMNDDGNVEIYSKNNLDEFTSYFSEKYNSNMEIVFIDLNLPDPDSLSLHKIFNDPSKNPNYLTFNLTNDSKCYGRLRMQKKNKIYVEAGRKLYIFDKKRLNSVHDFNKNDVTNEILQQNNFKRINFNKYEIIEL